MAKSVDNIRKQIDGMDDKIHDLLMQRAELVLKIGEEKRKSQVQIIQPDREILMIRRLLERHKGPLPKEAVVRIWRELVGAVSLLQTGLKVAVSVPDDSNSLKYWDMAKDYFSSVLPMQKVSNPLAALGMVREEEATFAVLPWPEDDLPQQWWPFLMDEESDRPMRIFARLPLGDLNDKGLNPEYRALVVAKLKPETSGDDRSFVGLELDATVSRARIVEKFQALDMKVLGIHSCAATRPDHKLHIIEIDTFIDNEDSRLTSCLESFQDPEARCVCLGGYPVPPIYGDKVGKNAV